MTGTKFNNPAFKILPFPAVSGLDNAYDASARIKTCVTGNMIRGAATTTWARDVLEGVRLASGAVAAGPVVARIARACEGASGVGARRVGVAVVGP